NSWTARACAGGHAGNNIQRGSRPVGGTIVGRRRKTAYHCRAYIAIVFNLNAVWLCGTRSLGLESDSQCSIARYEREGICGRQTRLCCDDDITHSVRRLHHVADGEQPSVATLQRTVRTHVSCHCLRPSTRGRCRFRRTEKSKLASGRTGNRI